MANDKDLENFAPADLVDIYELQESVGWAAHDLGTLLKCGLLRGTRNAKGATLINEESLLSLLKYRNITLEKSKYEFDKAIS